VWNEPNCGFWTAGQAGYFTLYENTALALKAVSSELKVGGPVTCQSAWIPEFIDFCEKNKVPYDFIATHEYPTDIKPVDKDVLTHVFTKARQQAGKNPLYYSEFNDGLYHPAYHDTPFSSAYLFKVMNDVRGLVDLMSWWTFSDIFEEKGQTSQPFFTHDGWGLLNIYQIPKPSYRAFELLHKLGTKYVPVKKVNGTSPTAGVWAVLSDTTPTVDVLIYNFDVPTATIANATVTVQIHNAKTTPTSATVYRIDETFANAPAAWVAMGSPVYPTKAQIAQLKAVSQLKPEKFPLTKVGTSYQFELVVPKWGVAFVEV